jgi:hypothetical protein
LDKFQIQLSGKIGEIRRDGGDRERGDREKRKRDCKEK